MRKHFLLLFLMALLPLAGWADSYEVKVRAMAFEISYGAATPTEVQDGMFMVTDWNGYPGDVDDKATVSAAIKAKLSFTSARAANSNVGNIPFTLSVADGDFVQRGGDYFFINIANANGTFKQLKAVAPIITAPAYVTSGLVYTSNEQSLLNAEALGTATVGTLTVDLEYAISTYDGAWSVPGDGDWGAENYKVTDAGKYKVLYRAVLSDNYEPAGGELAEEKVVAPADQSAAWEVVGATPTANTWTYDTEAHALFTAPTAPVAFGTYEYSLTGADETWYTSAQIAASEDLTAAFKGTSNTGNKTVYWRVKETANYSGHAATALTATINKATPEFTVLPTFAESRAYNGEELVQIVSAGETTLGAKPVFRRRTKGGNGSWGSWSEWKEDLSYFTRTNAGVCQIQYTTKTTNDLNPAIASPYGGPVTIEISKATTIAAESFTAPAAVANLVYSGGDQALITAGSWGENPVLGTFQYSLTNDGTDWSADVPQATNADNYNVYYKIVPTDATNCEEYVAAEPIEVAIDKANITTFTEPVAKTGLKADGHMFELVEAASWGENAVVGTFTYSTDGVDYSADIPAATVAGDYTVYFKMTPNDAANYNEFNNSYVVTIGDYKPVYIMPVAAQKIYGANDPTFTYTVVDATNPETTLDNSVLKGKVTLARTAGKNVGEYTIYVQAYTPGADEEYTVLNVLGNPDDVTANNKTAVFTIFADPTNVLTLKFTADAIANKSEKEYDGTTDIAALAFDVDDLEVVDGLNGTDTWETLKGLATVEFTLANKNVAMGNQVTATVTGLANYASVEVAPLPFSVTPLAITISANDQVIAQGGAIDQNEYTMAPAPVVGDELNVVLTATKTAVGVWEDAITVSAENTNYDFTFVPGDLEITGAGALALGEGGDDLQTIKDYANQPVNVTINFTARNARAATWKANTWNTLVLPFDISVADLSKKLGYAIVNVIDKSRTEISGTGSKFYGKLTMKGGNGSDDVLKANKPFMVKIADDIADVNGGVIDFGTQTIVAPATDADRSVDADEDGYVKFTGTYLTKTVTPADNQAFWFLIGNNDRWLYIGKNGSWDVLPFEGFIDMTNAPAGAHNMTFYFEELNGSTTAIKGISTDELNGKMAEGMYNMNGMKLNTVPTQKGVYILNGKKVVIK